MKSISTIAYRKFLLLLLVGIILGLNTNKGFAQLRVNSYVVQTFSSPFVSIVGQSGTTQLAITSGSVDDGYTTMTLPFNFSYDGKVITANTSIYAATNGLVSFSTAQTGCCSNYLGSSSYQGCACIWSTDLYLNQSYFYNNLVGTSPNRVFTIEWNNVRHYSSTNTGPTNWQMKLYENTSAIEYWYADWNKLMITGSTTVGYNGGVGLNGFSTPSFIYYQYQATYYTPSTNLRFTPIPPILVELGVLPQPRIYNFGSLPTGFTATTNVTVSNVGSNANGPARLSIRSVTYTGDPDFSIVSVPASSDSMNVGDSRQIVVKFAPIIDGLRSGSLTIVSNGLDSGTQTFALQGIGVAPLISVDTNVLFKNKFVKMGDSMVARVIISSTGLPTLFMTGYKFVGLDSGEYRISRFPSSNQIPGGTSDSIFVTYKPTKEGRHVATLNLLNNSINNPILPITLYGTAILPHIVVTPKPLRFDSVAMGVDSCKSIRIYNPGTDTLLIKSNALVSNDGDFHYTAITGADSIIPPDKFRDVTICFKPLQKGTRVARLRLQTNIIKTFEKVPRDTASQFLVDISGTGVPSSELNQSIGFAEPHTWADSALVGKTICTTDTLTNTGDADILITSIKFVGINASDYAFTPNLTFPITLKAKSTMVLHLCATPSARGVRNATLQVTGTMNEKPFLSNATASVVGLLPCAQALPTELFTNTLIPLGDSTLTVCDTVTNCGDITANYTASVVGNLASDYTVTPPAANNIAPGGTAIFCVTYKPSNRGISNASLKITTADTPDQTVGLSGSGGCSHLTASLGPDALGPFGKGGHYTITVNIQNTGEIDWVPDAGNPFVIGTDAGLLTANTPALGTITAGGNAQVTFDFHPGNTNTPFSIPIGFVGGPCRDTTGVLFSGTTNDAKVNDPVAKQGFVLGVNHPNPFAGATQFTYTTPTEASVTLSLRDVTGKLIRTISNGPVSSGEHTVVFNAGELSSGNYLLMLESGDVTLMRQVIIAK
jgi:hypothetical protein